MGNKQLMHLYLFFCEQKTDSFQKPLVDQYCKEGRDKKVQFEAIFSKANCKVRWFIRKEVDNKLYKFYL